MSLLILTSPHRVGSAVNRSAELRAVGMFNFPDYYSASSSASSAGLDGRLVEQVS